jgi:hypothetical protein
MLNQVSLDINDASSHVYLAGVAAEAIARAFLANHPYSPRYLSSTANQDAIRAMQTVLQVMRVFDERSFCPDEEKRLAYVQFVSTIHELAKAPGHFSNELREKQVMGKICDSLGKLFYGRPEIGHQILDHVDPHVKLLRATWFTGEPQLREESRNRPQF